MDLAGKTAFVTGSSRGVGKAIARELAARGADIVVHYLSSEEGALDTVRQAEALGRRAFTVRGNVSNPEDLSEIFGTIREKAGALDIFVSNAATGKLSPAMEMTARGWEKTLDTNARAFLLGVQRAVPLMEGRKGTIISISSLGSHKYIPNYVAVGASKAALESLTRTLAVELGPRNIRVNCVSTGVLDTDALKHFPTRDQMIELAIKRTPLGRMGTPEDVAKVVAMLCGDDADWICGQVIVADGGYSLLS